MSDGNGISARVGGLEKGHETLWGELKEHRDIAVTLGREQAVQRNELENHQKDFAELVQAVSRLTRAFWAAAATMGTLAIAIIAVVVTILTNAG